MISVALIDAGDWLQAYATVLHRIPDVRLTAVVQSDTESSRTTYPDLQVELTADSLENLLRDHGHVVDAVVVHSRPRLRPQLVRQAALAGKHVLVETPIALSLHEADEVFEACASAGVRLMVAQPRRYMPYERVAHDSLVSGKLGRPGLLRIHRWIPWGEEGLRSPRAEASLLETVIGELDVACWLFDGLPDAVYALADKPGKGDRYLQVHLGFSGGGMALVDVWRSDSPYFSLTMIGSQGAVYADDHRNASWVCGGPYIKALAMDQGHDHVRLQLSEFTEFLRLDRQPTQTREDARRTISVAAAMGESLASGRVIHRRDRASA
jgi:myo-inositol 2-dehydrogenase/D-chiro-inositol 1-dehydrogenase